MDVADTDEPSGAKKVIDHVKAIDQGHQVAINADARNSDRSEKTTAGSGRCGRARTCSE